ncbi:MAG TPA: 3-hydroxylacyl-ACP dehydratase [Burkholderiales bacterium]|nr:3-hydroxylacyl-ACP dehydratase [Burkholderiales bacterium]
MTLGREQIAALVPQRGAMCLLERVVSWDAAGIVCASASHRRADNPLRARGRLHAVAGIEYAAQAVALHGALAAREGGAIGPGVLASLRDVELEAERLDLIPGELLAIAEALVVQQRHMLYAFRVEGDGRILLRGRAAIALVAGTDA